MLKDRQFKGPIDCIRQIIRVQGLGGLWSGFTGSLVFRSNFFWMFLSVEVRISFSLVIAPAGIEFSHGSSADFNASFLDLCWDPIRGILFKRILIRSFLTHPSKISTGTAHFLSGGLGSFVFWGMGIPFDNIKRRVHIGALMSYLTVHMTVA